jgi:pilus assembly protein CpaB
MTGRRRRAAVLLGLALLLGALAASDVARREAAIEARFAPVVGVVVARKDLGPGRELRLSDLTVRRMPARFAAAGSASEPAELVGHTVAVAVPAGGYLAAGQLRAPEPGGAAGVRRGERAADVVGVGSADVMRAGARVDVLVTRGGGGGGDAGRSGGATHLALEDVEVLAVGPAPQGGSEGDVPRVSATLRVTVRQAVYLAAAQSFARELRFLARAPGDRRRSGAMAVGEALR